MSLAKLNAKKLTSTEINVLVEAFSKELRLLPGIEEIILFGSAARREMTDASDIDIVAIFSHKDSARLGAKIFHQNRKTFWPVDILFVDRDYYLKKIHLGGVLFVAHEEGISIFKKSK